MLIRDLLHLACSRLEKAGIENADTDASFLLGHCLEKSRTELYLQEGEEVGEREASEFLSLLEKRERRIPLGYILGVQEFWSLDFLVTADVLIPRPETELLIEKGIAVFQELRCKDGVILDLCCGSGIIAVVLARELGVPVVAIDISMEALRIARKNAIRHGVSHLVSFLQADLLSAIQPLPGLSLVLSNPPYVSREAIAAGLQPEVAEHEPELALDGGKKGLEIIARLRDELSTRMMRGGHFLMEIGEDQGAEVLSIFAGDEVDESPFSQLRIEKDYSGHDRIFSATVDS